MSEIRIKSFTKSMKRKVSLEVIGKKFDNIEVGTFVTADIHYYDEKELLEAMERVSAMARHSVDADIRKNLIALKEMSKDRNNLALVGMGPSLEYTEEEAKKILTNEILDLALPIDPDIKVEESNVIEEEESEELDDVEETDEDIDDILGISDEDEDSVSTSTKKEHNKNNKNEDEDEENIDDILGLDEDEEDDKLKEKPKNKKEDKSNDDNDDLEDDLDFLEDIEDDEPDKKEEKKSLKNKTSKKQDDDEVDDETEWGDYEEEDLDNIDFEEKAGGLFDD